jgi:hypothetical protein
MDTTKYKSINLVLLSVGIFAPLGFMTYASGGIDGLLDLYTLWTILPFFVLLLITLHTSSRETLIATTILGTLCLLSTYLYFDSLFIHPDAQGALIFIFLPLYQLFSIIVGFIVFGIVKFISQRK